VQGRTGLRRRTFFFGCQSAQSFRRQLRRLLKRRKCSCHFSFQVDVPVEQSLKVVNRGVPRSDTPVRIGPCLFHSGLGRRNRCQAARRSLHVALVSPVFDLSARASPILLQRVEALHHCLKPEALRCALEADLTQLLNASHYLFVLHTGLALLDAHEVLFIQDAQALESVLQLSEILFCFLFLCHEIRLPSSFTLALVFDKCA
jgi:hypothetical protein